MGSTSVFVSYRRDDSKHAAGRLGERLDERFKLFMDIDSIRPGTDFTAVVRNAVDHADVVLALIGSSWLAAKDETGARRLDNPEDWVALEIGTALRQGTPVIPVLVDGAHMPDRSELPAVLAELANRQAIKLTHESFAADCTRLIETIETMMGGRSSPEVDLWADADYPAARSALLQGQWDTAIAGLERVLRRHPRQQQVIDQLADARRRHHLIELDQRARDAVAAEHWSVAADVLAEIQTVSPSEAVAERLADARRRLEVDNLHHDLVALADRGDWSGVVAADEVLAAIDPGAADHEGLATRARVELLTQQLEADYRRGLQELDAGRWADGAATFASILALRPGYRDCKELQEVARRRGAPAPAPAPAVPNATPTVRATHGRLVAGLVVAVVVVGVGVAVVATRGHDDPAGNPSARLGGTAGPTASEAGSGETTTPGSDASAAGPLPASGTELVAAPDLSVGATDGTYAMAARTGGVRIDGLADVDQVGSGTAARVAPVGGRLRAFHLTTWPCAVPPCRKWTKLDLQVRVGSETRALPDASGTYVVALPQGTTEAELVMQVDGVTQTLSLLTGQPGARNIAVLARPHLTTRVGATVTLTDTTSKAIQYGDGVGRLTATRNVSIRSATLGYYVGGREPRSPSHAFLRFDATFTRPYAPGTTYLIQTGEMRFRADDGTVYDGVEADLDPKKTHTTTVFEVPADITGGTLLLGGVTRSLVDTQGGSYRDTLSARPVPIHLS